MSVKMSVTLTTVTLLTAHSTSVKERTITAITPFKVIEGQISFRYTNHGKPVGLCDFLLVNNTDLYSISHRF